MAELTLSSPPVSGPSQRINFAAWQAALLQIEQLATVDLPRSAYLQRVLQILVGAGASAGSVWWIDADKTLVRIAEFQLERLQLSTNLSATRHHQVLLTGAFQSERPSRQSLPHLPQPTDSIILVPLNFLGRRIGVIDLFVQSQLLLEIEADVLLVLFEISGHISRALDRIHEAATTLDPTRFLELFGSFLNELHAAPTGHDVALLAVNQLRTVLHVDRVSLYERHGGRYRLTAISGQAVPDSRANQILALSALVHATATLAEPFVFTGDVQSLPSVIRSRVESYVELSQTRMLMIRPWRPASSVPLNESPGKPRTKTQRRDATPPASVLVFEQFSDSQPKPAVQRHSDRLSQQVGLALRNSRRYERLLLIPGLRTLGEATHWLTGRRWAWMLGAVLAIGLTGLALCHVQGDYTVEGRGRLMPLGQRRLFAPWDGEIVECFVHGGEQVQQGDPLFRVDSPELRAQLLLVENQLNEKRKLLAALEVEQHVNANQASRDSSLRLQAQLEAAKIEIESLQAQIALLRQQVASLTVLAPQSGTATLLRATDQLLGRPVHRGEHLLDVMDESGEWRLEIALPEPQTLPVIQAYQGTEPPTVAFRLLANPTELQSARLTALDDQTRPTSQGDSVLHVFADIDETQLLQRRIGADIVARIDCGRRSLLEIYFGETIDFVRRQLWL